MYESEKVLCFVPLNGRQAHVLVHCFEGTFLDQIRSLRTNFSLKSFQHCINLYFPSSTKTLTFAVGRQAG